MEYKTWTNYQKRLHGNVFSFWKMPFFFLSFFFFALFHRNSIKVSSELTKEVARMVIIFHLQPQKYRLESSTEQKGGAFTLLPWRFEPEISRMNVEDAYHLSNSLFVIEKTFIKLWRKREKWATKFAFHKWKKSSSWSYLL